MDVGVRGHTIAHSPELAFRHSGHTELFFPFVETHCDLYKQCMCYCCEMIFSTSEKKCVHACDGMFCGMLYLIEDILSAN